MSLSQADKNLLSETINQTLSQIPAFLRGTVNAQNITLFLKGIPSQFRNYTLLELIEAVEESCADGKIKG
jgi:hypothetical protein